MIRVLMSGGGTGGHVYPALSVLDALRELVGEENIQILYVGHRRGVEATLVPRRGVPLRTIPGGQVRGQSPWTLTRNLVLEARGYVQARRIVREFQPHVGFITGGWVTVPVAVALRRAGVPFVIYLPDVSPGLAIRTLQRLAQSVTVTVEEAATYFPGKAVVTGYPVRKAVLEARRDQAREQLGLPQEDRVVLVFGGSRGARSINRAVVAHAQALLSLAHVVHMTGSLDYGWVSAAARELPSDLRARYHVYEYLHEEMPLALAAADVVVSRAGASVLGEFPARGLPAVLVPYPHAGRHQERNARYLVDRGAAVLVDDEHLGRDLVPTLRGLLEDEVRRRRMADAARSAFRANGARNIACELLRWGGHPC